MEHTSSLPLSTLFQGCVALAQDDYWKTIYTNCIKGKYPPGYQVKDVYLIFRHKKRPDKIILPMYDVNLFYMTCDSFFRRTSGMMSNKEKTQRWENRTHNMIQTKWTNIVTPSQKRVLVDIYIASLKQKYKLTPHEVQQLEHIMVIGFIMQYFNKIDMSPHGFIENIHELEFDETSRVFSFTKPIKKKKLLTTSTSSSSSSAALAATDAVFSAQWTKFLKYLSKCHKETSLIQSMTTSVAPSPMLQHAIMC